MLQREHAVQDEITKLNSNAASSSSSSTDDSPPGYKNDWPVVLDNEEDIKIAEQAMLDVNTFIQGLKDARDKQVLLTTYRDNNFLYYYYYFYSLYC